MMSNNVLHPLTKQRLQAFSQTPSHALLLIGPPGSGKQSVATNLAAEIFQINRDSLDNHPYIKKIEAGKEKSISIEKVRELEHFLSRKVPERGKRVVLIYNAHLLGIEAQNALLKTLEEPPANTILILTVANEQALLPTVRSRAQSLSVLRPGADHLKAHFESLGYSAVAIQRAIAMSGGLPGLMFSILQDEDNHPLVRAAAIARQIAGSSPFERLAIVDSLSKDREHCLEVLGVLQQMARWSLRGGKNAVTWQKILSACHKAIGELVGNGQPKLVLTNLMLSL